jgi:hypothetical protein
MEGWRKEKQRFLRNNKSAIEAVLNYFKVVPNFSFKINYTYNI